MKNEFNGVKRWRTAGLLIFGTLMAIQMPTAFAHHSYTSWAPTYVTIKDATVKDYEYTSPHIWVQVLITDADGNQVEWGLESGSPASMKQDGWTPNMLQAGDKVTAIVHPRRDGSKTGSIVELDLPNGKVMKVRDLVLLQPGNAAPCPPGSTVTQPATAGGPPGCVPPAGAPAAVPAPGAPSPSPH